ncbi:hypothetical protein AYO44_11855 [Planctomycetaceae bacterium SCGC AG-212-F19]|nr:hypothetical protein AYO44_11855 [Planctomycetaceae bacterium SCGC AG-212-F19]
MILLGVGIFVAGFIFCGGGVLLLKSLTGGTDTRSQAKGPTAPVTTAPRPGPTSAKATSPATLPKITVPVPTGLLGPKKGDMPTEAELRQLVTGTLLDLDQGIKTKDFTAFHGRLAGPFQKDKTPKDLQMSFQNFIDSKPDFSSIKDVAPKFEPAPVLGPDGVLLVKGYFPAKGLRLGFELRYVFEQTAWKLVGWGLDVSQERVAPMG